MTAHIPTAGRSKDLDPAAPTELTGGIFFQCCLFSSCRSRKQLFSSPGVTHALRSSFMFSHYREGREVLEGLPAPPALVWREYSSRYTVQDARHLFIPFHLVGDDVVVCSPSLPGEKFPSLVLVQHAASNRCPHPCTKIRTIVRAL